MHSAILCDLLFITHDDPCGYDGLILSSISRIRQLAETSERREEAIPVN